ncbi:hypothetical protein [Zooshikella sp. RANM57]|uniref:hypothetical protein n=1 Tax=Zooshikella sp. RANM57 TaxID=3425863 RepID=UPI003D6EF365
MKKIFLFLFLFLCTISLMANSEPNYQSGKIVNLTAITGGIMIMMDKGLPDNCVGSPYGWMLIKQEYSAMTSVVIAAWASGKTVGTVYTSGREDGQGYCLVTQFDPDN